MKLIECVSELSEKFYSIEEINYEAEVEKVLKGLGFEREDFNRKTSEFSGGWRMRIELAKILLKKPDLILCWMSLRITWIWKVSNGWKSS